MHLDEMRAALSILTGAPEPASDAFICSLAASFGKHLNLASMACWKKVIVCANCIKLPKSQSSVASEGLPVWRTITNGDVFLVAPQMG